MTIQESLEYLKEQLDSQQRQIDLLYEMIKELKYPANASQGMEK